MPSKSGELYCPRCGYDVTGLPQPRCPECGDAFEWDELEYRRTIRYRLGDAVRDTVAAPALISLVVVVGSRLGAPLCMIAPLAVLVITFGSVEAAISIARKYTAVNARDRFGRSWWRAAIVRPHLLDCVLFVLAIGTALLTGAATVWILTAIGGILMA